MVRLGFVSSILIALGASSAHAGFVTHAGSNDPASEGFASLVSSGTTGSVDDGGVPAWMIQTHIPAATYFYFSPVFTASQRGDLAQGFELTLTARAIPGSAPSGSALGGVFIDIGDRRFEMYLIRNFGLSVTLVLIIEADKDTVHQAGEAAPVLGLGRHPRPVRPALAG